MARRLYLHVGTMKSATTYLQSVLDANRQQLDDAGVMWLPSGANHQAVGDFARSKQSAPDARGAWRSFRKAVHEYDGDVLLSSELMGPYGPPRIRRLVQALAPEEQTRVIITARDLTKVIPSHWQETTQNMGITPWREWVDRACLGPTERGPDFRFWTHHDLPGIITNWSVGASEGQVYLVTVPKSPTDPEQIWRRFASVLELRLPSLNPPVETNPALGAVSAELMRRINLELQGTEFPRYGPGFKHALAKEILVQRAAGEPRPALTADDYARLRKIALDLVDQVRTLEVNVVGDLDDLVPAEEPPGAPFDPADVTDTELLTSAVGGLAGLGLLVTDQRRQIHDQRRQLAAQRAETTLARPSEPEPEPAVATRAGDKWRGRLRRWTSAAGRRLRSAAGRLRG